MIPRRLSLPLSTLILCSALVVCAALARAQTTDPAEIVQTPESAPLHPIPDRLVVLTFDDSVKSQAAFVAPLLKRLGFGATFFITEGFNFETDKTYYMTWAEIRGLSDMGFEVGNHTRAHKAVADQTSEEFLGDLESVEKRCAENGIPAPTSFAYPGNSIHLRAVEVLKRKGYRFARRGGAPEFPYEQGRGRAYDPREDHPLLIPTAGDARPFWTIEDFKLAVAEAKPGTPAVIQFHGVPDVEHPWVSFDPKLFEACMDYLKENKFAVIALRDLSRYVDPTKGPDDPFAPIKKRAAEK